MDKKIAFINQRYGAEVIGGSETYTREMAEHLAGYPGCTAEIEVLTNQVLGMGIEARSDADGAHFREKYDIKGEYLIFAGRIEENKGCGELFRFFVRFREEAADMLKERYGGLTLVLMGKSSMSIPQRDDIRYLGFVPEEDKHDGMKGARVICLPSKYESFSISLLEGMSYGHPALVNGSCEVLKGHMERSGGGLCYTDYHSFREGLITLLDKETNQRLGSRAAEYVGSEYGWDKVLERFCALLWQK